MVSAIIVIAVFLSILKNNQPITYTNATLGFKIDLPFGWYVQNTSGEAREIIGKRLFYLLPNASSEIEISQATRTTAPSFTEKQEINNKTFYYSQSGALYYLGEQDVVVFTLKNTNPLQLDRLIDLLSRFSRIEKPTTINAFTNYAGKISPAVPYTELIFKEIDVHSFTPTTLAFTKSNFQQNGKMYIGYTFTANEGEHFEFVAEEDRGSNPGNIISTELYGYGPTVIKMDTRIGWGVPVTGRYFYVISLENYKGLKPDDKGEFGRFTLYIK